MTTLERFENIDSELQNQIIDLFTKEWKCDYTYNLIYETWCKRKDDVLLVLILNKTLIGTVGLDHKYKIPIVSHLYIVETFRSNGYGKYLMNEIVKHSDKKIHGWCVPNRVKYYEELGWKKDSWFGLSYLYTKMISFCTKDERMVPMSRYGLKRHHE